MKSVSCSLVVSLLLLAVFSSITRADECLQSGQTVTTDLTFPDEVDRYCFQATAGDSITVIMSNANEVGCRIELFDPDALFLKQEGNDSEATVTLRDIHLIKTGTYTIKCRSINGANENIHYGLTLINNAAINNGSIQSGETVYGQLLLGDADAYSFSGAEGETVTILMGNDSSSDLQLELHGPDGSLLKRVIAASDQSLSVDIEDFKLPASGTFMILCRTASGFNRINQYGLTLIKNTGLNNGSIQSGETVYGQLLLGDADAYSFSGAEGETVTILMGNDSSSDLQLELHGPDGSLLKRVIAASDQSLSVDIEDFKLPASGTFMILCRTASGFNEINRYGLTLINISGPNNVDPDEGPILDAIPRLGSLELGDIDVFTFRASVGDSVSIIGRFSGHVGRIELYSPDGHLVAKSAFNVRVSCLALPGTYKILVRAEDGGLVFPYQLSLESNPLISIRPNDPNPHLIIYKCESRISAHCLTNTAGFKLQICTNLNSPLVWKNVTDVPEIAGDQYFLDIAATPPSAFYRLFRP